jgi:hypothetical protein
MILVPLGPLMVTWTTLKADPATGSTLASPLWLVMEATTQAPGVVATVRPRREISWSGE